MKRYRILCFDFDTRANILRREIHPDQDESMRKHWEETQSDIRASILREFGEVDADIKLQNFIDVGATSPSVIAFHNRFSAQVRRAFVIGAYYPALTGACALGERILNHLILRLREDFRKTKEYKKVYNKESFALWKVPIDALASWGVLLPAAKTACEELAAVRNRVIHFHPDTDSNDRAMALEAISLLKAIINAQFPMMGSQPWFIPNVLGESFIKRECERDPFVREIYLPNCRYVGPDHLIGSLFPETVVRDRDDYPDQEITDAEFVRLRVSSRGPAPFDT